MLKIDYSIFRIQSSSFDYFLAGNALISLEYQRRWQAVRDLGDVTIRLQQAEGWMKKYQIKKSPLRQGHWLEYLFALNIAQFRSDIAAHILESNKKKPELHIAATATAFFKNLSWSQTGMLGMFEINNEVQNPHTSMGNQVELQNSFAFIRLLFDWEQSISGAWHKKTYRFIFRKTYELIREQLGSSVANSWRHHFYAAILLTHWILPYATATAFLLLSKTNKNKGLQGRTTWFSSVLMAPQNMHELTTAIRRDRQASSSIEQWRIIELIDAYQQQGLRLGRNVKEGQSISYFRLGFFQSGTTLVPDYEKGLPLPLKTVKEIQGKTLDELDCYIQEQFNSGIFVASEARALAIQTPIRSIRQENSSSRGRQRHDR